MTRRPLPSHFAAAILAAAILAAAILPGAAPAAEKLTVLLDWSVTPE